MFACTRLRSYESRVQDKKGLTFIHSRLVTGDSRLLFLKTYLKNLKTVSPGGDFDLSRFAYFFR